MVVDIAKFLPKKKKIINKREKVEKVSVFKLQDRTTRIMAVIETPRNSRNIYRYDLIKDELYLEKVLLSPLSVPYNIAVLPGTLWYNNRRLRTMILIEDVIPPRTIVYIKPLALIRLKRGKVDDSMLISKLENDENLKDIYDLSNINELHLKEIRLYFENLREYDIYEFVDKNHALNALKFAIEKHKIKRRERV